MRAPGVHSSELLILQTTIQRGRSKNIVASHNCRSWIYYASALYKHQSVQCASSSMAVINGVSLLLFALFGALQTQLQASSTTDVSTSMDTSTATSSSSVDTTTAAAATSTASASAETSTASESTSATSGVTSMEATTAAPVVSTTTLSTRKPWPKPNCQNPSITNGLRNIFLHYHNELRGSLARGQTQASFGWGIAPPATLMYRMRYDCNAESYAQQAVNTCTRTQLPAYATGGHKQNLFIFNNPGATPQTASLHAISSWWGQLARFGMRSNMMFYQSEFNRGTRSVLNWAKMAWWNSRYVGCAVKNCGSFYAVSCMYYPGGANVNQYVYQVGAVCSGCPPGQCDGQALCRWE